MTAKWASNAPQLHTVDEFCHISAPGCTLEEAEVIVARINAYLERLGGVVTVRSPHLCPLPVCCDACVQQPCSSGARTMAR